MISGGGRAEEVALLRRALDYAYESLEAAQRTRCESVPVMGLYDPNIEPPRPVKRLPQEDFIEQLTYRLHMLGEIYDREFEVDFSQF